MQKQKMLKTKKKIEQVAIGKCPYKGYLHKVTVAFVPESFVVRSC
jgi:hypothetical protein